MKVIEVLFPISAVNHNVIYVCLCEHVIDHSLESGLGTVKFKRHNGELKEAKRGCKCCLLLGPLSHRDLPISTSQVQGGDYGGRANTLKHFFNAWPGVGIEL